MAKVVDPNKAKQGRSGWQVLVVLVCALVLAMIVWWAVEIFGNAIEPADTTGGNPAEQPAEAPSPAPAEAPAAE